VFEPGGDGVVIVVWRCQVQMRWKYGGQPVRACVRTSNLTDMVYDDVLSTGDRVPRRWWTEETRQRVSMYRVEVMTCQAGVKHCVRVGVRTSARVRVSVTLYQL
jgi:hypothetical protein